MRVCINGINATTWYHSQGKKTRRWSEISRSYLFTPLKSSEIGVAQNCCCRRILYNQPDFTNVKSLLEERCKVLGVLVLFLCVQSHQGKIRSKRTHCSHWRPFPSTLNTMRKFATRSRRFMDAYYDQGLNGRQAAWAARKYRGHRVIPASIMDELEKAGVV